MTWTHEEIARHVKGGSITEYVLPGPYGRPLRFRGRLLASMDRHWRPGDPHSEGWCVGYELYGTECGNLVVLAREEYPVRLAACATAVGNIDSLFGHVGTEAATLLCQFAGIDISVDIP